MVDTNSPEYQIFMTYIGVSLIIKGTKMVINCGRVLLNSPMPIP
jgi:hypothetical protein